MDFSILGDGELAARFAEGGADGDAAFGELVQRHGAMVFRTCRRVTGHRADAEDAAQLTFAALAQHAVELVDYTSLGGGSTARRGTPPGM